MKPVTTKLLFQGYVIALALVLSSCSASRKSFDKTEWSVLLREQAPSDHMIVNYQTPFALESCQRVSRSENRWNVSIKASKGIQRKLLRKMANDSLIVDVQILSQEPNEPSNSTNGGHSKSNPIRNQ